MNFILQRPIAPHLLIYVAQSSSLSSILHRFSAIIMTMYFFNFNIYLTYLNLNLFTVYVNWYFLSFLFFISLSYHFINGLKSVLADLKIFI